MSRRLQSVRAGILTHFPENAPRIEIDTGQKDNRLRVVDGAGDGFHAAADLSPCSPNDVLHKKLRDLRLTDMKVGRIFQGFPHGARIGLFVCLCPERMNCRTLGTVQHLRLYKGLVDIMAHLAAKRVQFPHQMSL